MTPEPTQPCGAFEDDLKAYLDGELSFFRRLQVRRHLRHCTSCQEEINIMETVAQELKESESSSPLGADLRAKILENAPDTSLQPVSESASKRRYMGPIEYGMVFAGLCFVIIAGLSVTGNRIKNTFNSAANSLSPGGYSDEASPAASSGGSIGGPVGIAGAPSRAAERGNLNRSNFQTFDGHIKSPGQNETWVTANRVGGANDYQNVVPAQRAVHKEGSISVAVDDAEAKSNAVEVIIKNVGGFVANNALSTGTGGQKTATLDVRIPVAQFESVVAKIGQLGKVRGKSVNGEDITQQVTQAGARQQSLQDELSIREAQLREAKKAASKQAIITDVRGLRMQAAQARAQLEYLKKYAALSTLFVTLQDKPAAVTPAGWSQSLGQTGNEAWRSFLSSAKLPLQLLIWILAYSPLWLPALIVWKRWGQKLVMGQ